MRKDHFEYIAEIVAWRSTQDDANVFAALLEEQRQIAHRQMQPIRESLGDLWSTIVKDPDRGLQPYETYEAARNNAKTALQRCQAYMLHPEAVDLDGFGFDIECYKVIPVPTLGSGRKKSS